MTPGMGGPLKMLEGLCCQARPVTVCDPATVQQDVNIGVGLVLEFETGLGNIWLLVQGNAEIPEFVFRPREFYIGFGHDIRTFQKGVFYACLYELWYTRLRADNGNRVLQQGFHVYDLG